MRDYPLHELSAHDFENLIIIICEKILGIATINFSEGPDGGRDGFFEGTANNFPSQSKPWKGKFIIQAKRTLNQNASCSDADFKYLIENKEVPKIKKLCSSKTKIVIINLGQVVLFYLSNEYHLSPVNRSYYKCLFV